MSRLPADLTQLIGRTREIRTVRSMLSKARLVSVTGTGGVGKSRVAVAAARSAERAYRDGIRYLDLSLVQDPLLLPSVLAAATDPAGGGETSRMSRPGGWEGVVVLDNCEHLVEACASAVYQLLEQTPNARVIVTSRERLGVAGEHILRLEPLTLPGHGPVTAADLARFESVQLLTDRAQAVRPAFEVTDENAVHVAALCRSLEGLPLAIELAAARLGSMSVTQIVDYFADPTRLLGTTWRTSAGRQASLEQTIAWSYQLCSAAEQELWGQLSVFAGPVDLPALRAVRATEADEPELMDLLDGLVSKSVLVYQHGDVPRYQLASTLRHFGLCRLAPEERETFRERHAHFFERAAHEAADAWFGPDQLVLSAWLRTSLPDLRLALDHALTRLDPVRAADFAVAIQPLWVHLGRLHEGSVWLERVLALSPHLPARVHFTYGWIMLSSGHIGVGREYLARAQELGSAEGDASSADLADTLLGIAAGFDGQFDEAIERCERALARRTEAGDDGVTATMLMLMGELLAVTGNTQEVLRCCAEAERICRAHQEMWCLSLVYWVRGLAHCLRGEAAEAIAAARTSLAMKVALDDRAGMLLAAEVLCWSLAASDQWAAAARLIAAIQSTSATTEVPLGDFSFLKEQRRWWAARIVEGFGPGRYAAISGSSSALDFDHEVAQVLDPVPASGPDRPVPTGSGPLTKRETEVAELVAAGLSNREVAGRLVISLRTAEVHVGRILVKLGLNSRTQLAAWWHEGS